MAKQVTRKERDVVRQGYVVEIAKGVALTSRAFVKNLFGRVAGDGGDTVTVQYPEQKTPYPDRFRGKHRLMKRDDGDVRCVACMLCSTACPANCITIVAGEHEDVTIEKYPEVFQIDLLKCIYCGFCAEACPCDAIRMDSGRHTLPTMDRRTQHSGKIDLLSLGGETIAIQGGEHRSDPHHAHYHGKPVLEGGGGGHH